MTRIRLTLSAGTIRHIVASGGQHPDGAYRDDAGITFATGTTFALALSESVASVTDTATRGAALLQTIADAACVQRLAVLISTEAGGAALISTEAGGAALSYEIWRARTAPAPVWRQLLQAIAALGYVYNEFPVFDEDNIGDVPDWHAAEVIVM
jgi:hypothetical protein